MKSIAFFNNKGGVGKTTLLCNFASYVCKEIGKKVLVIDGDPQCNTTTYVLDDEQFYQIYFEPKDFTIADLVPPLENGDGFIKNFTPIMSKYFGFDLLPGNPKFAACEDFLANEWRDVKSNEIRGIRSTLLFSHLLSLCDKYDYVFFDMGPSLGAINRSILLACDYFITPMASDVFSLLALGNIGQSINTWSTQFNNGVNGLDKTKREMLNNMRHSCKIKFLGFVEQQYITKTVEGKARAVRAYDKILQKIPDEIREKVVIPINQKEIENFDYKIGSIPNYHSLVPMSQTAHKPIFDLTSTDGVVGAHYQKVREFHELMKEIVQVAYSHMEAIK